MEATKCSPTEEHIHNSGIYIYTTVMEYYSATKRDETGSSVETWMDPEALIQSEASHKDKKQIPYINIYTWNLEKWYR